MKINKEIIIVFGLLVVSFVFSIFAMSYQHFKTNRKVNSETIYVEVFLSIEDEKSKEYFIETNKLQQKYPERLKISYYFVDKSGPGYTALLGIKAAEKQNSRIEFINILYSNINNYSTNNIISYSSKIDIDKEKFKENLLSGELYVDAEAELKKSEQYGITSVPIIIFDNNSTILDNLNDFESIVKKELE